MYIRPKKVFWTLVLLAALLYAGAHVLVRTSWARAQVLRALSVRTGYAASASEIRFTPGLALSFKDFRLESPASADAGARIVAEAPWLRLGRCRGGWSVRAPRARLAAFRGNGVWTPSQATGAEECPGACVFPRISPAFGRLWFDVEDAQVSFDDGAETTSFAGVSWTRAPVRIPGRPGAVQNRLSWLKGPIRGDVTAEMASRGSDEWYELPGGIARFATQGGSVEEKPHAEFAEKSHAEFAESAEIGVIGGEDGPTSVWLSTKAKAEDLPPKEDMVKAFREFFETDPKTAQAFFEAVDAAKADVAAPDPKENHAESAEPAVVPEPEKTHAESAEAESHAESAESTEPVPAPEAPHAESAESTEPVPAPEVPHAESAEPAENGGASSPSEPPASEEKSPAE